MAGFREDFWNLPNMLTMVRIVLIPVVCVLVALESPGACLWAAALFGLASITDFLDGYLARLRGLVSMTGKFLDPLADKLIVMAALVVLVGLGWMPAWLVVVVLARELAINGLRSLASAEGIVMASGMAGKYKTAFQLTGLVCLLIHYQYTVDFLFVTSEVRFHLVGMTLFAVSVFFSLWSAVTYAMGFYQELGARSARVT